LNLGGNGGGVVLDTGSAANLGLGTRSMRGANSSGSGGEGGNANFSIDTGVAGDIYFDGTIDVSDGSGEDTALGTEAGGITFLTTLGDIQVSGTLLLNGGHGTGGAPIDGPTSGGSVLIIAGNGTVTDGGSITFRGVIQANGGSGVDDAVDNDGGE